MRLVALLVLVAMSLAGCDEPILSPNSVPPGVPTAGLAFHRTKWFECAAAIYRLDADFAASIGTNGLNDELQRANWKPTPVPVGSSKAASNLSSTLKCLEGAQPYASLFQDRAYAVGAYYALGSEGGTNIIAPADGLLLIGGYE